MEDPTNSPPLIHTPTQTHTLAQHAHTGAHPGGYVAPPSTPVVMPTGTTAALAPTPAPVPAEAATAPAAPHAATPAPHPASAPVIGAPASTATAPPATTTAPPATATAPPATATAPRATAAAPPATASAPVGTASAPVGTASAPAGAAVAAAVAAAQDDQDEIVERSPQGHYARRAKLLGKGSFKSVYRGVDLENGFDVAWNEVKIGMYEARDRKRFLNEVALLRQLHHPNLISFYGAWVNKEQEKLVFITELMSSGTLREFCAKWPISCKQVKRYCKDILECIRYLHTPDGTAQKPVVIHRDLKCDNIFMQHNVIKIGDLGLATTDGRTVLGTPEFMAPEMMQPGYGSSVDIYAFGLCVLEMITGKTPYSECTNAVQIVRKSMAGELPENIRVLEAAWPEAHDFVLHCLTPRMIIVPDASAPPVHFTIDEETAGPASTTSLASPPLSTSARSDTGTPVLPATGESDAAAVDSTAPTSTTAAASSGAQLGRPPRPLPQPLMAPSPGGASADASPALQGGIAMVSPPAAQSAPAGGAQSFFPGTASSSVPAPATTVASTRPITLHTPPPAGTPAPSLPPMIYVRPTAAQLLEHPFLREGPEDAVRNTEKVRLEAAAAGFPTVGSDKDEGRRLDLPAPKIPRVQETTMPPWQAARFITVGAGGGIAPSGTLLSTSSTAGTTPPTRAPATPGSATSAAGTAETASAGSASAGAEVPTRPTAAVTAPPDSVGGSGDDAATAAAASSSADATKPQVAGRQTSAGAAGATPTRGVPPPSSGPFDSTGGQASGVAHAQPSQQSSGTDMPSADSTGGPAATGPHAPPAAVGDIGGATSNQRGARASVDPSAAAALSAGSGEQVEAGAESGGTGASTQRASVHAHVPNAPGVPRHAARDGSPAGPSPISDSTGMGTGGAVGQHADAGADAASADGETGGPGTAQPVSGSGTGGVDSDTGVVPLGVALALANPPPAPQAPERTTSTADTAAGSARRHLSPPLVRGESDGGATRVPATLPGSAEVDASGRPVHSASHGARAPGAESSAAAPRTSAAHEEAASASSAAVHGPSHIAAPAQPVVARSSAAAALTPSIPSSAKTAGSQRQSGSSSAFAKVNSAAAVSGGTAPSGSRSTGGNAGVTLNGLAEEVRDIRHMVHALYVMVEFLVQRQPDGAEWMRARREKVRSQKALREVEGAPSSGGPPSSNASSSAITARGDRDNDRRKDPRLGPSTGGPMRADPSAGAAPVAAPGVALRATDGNAGLRRSNTQVSSASPIRAATASAVSSALQRTNPESAQARLPPARTSTPTTPAVTAKPSLLQSGATVTSAAPESDPVRSAPADPLNSRPRAPSSSSAAARVTSAQGVAAARADGQNSNSREHSAAGGRGVRKDGSVARAADLHASGVHVGEHHDSDEASVDEAFEVDGTEHDTDSESGAHAASGEDSTGSDELGDEARPVQNGLQNGLRGGLPMREHSSLSLLTSNHAHSNGTTPLTATTPVTASSPVLAGQTGAASRAVDSALAPLPPGTAASSAPQDRASARMLADMERQRRELQVAFERDMQAEQERHTREMDRIAQRLTELAKADASEDGAQGRGDSAVSALRERRDELLRAQQRDEEGLHQHNVVRMRETFDSKMKWYASRERDIRASARASMPEAAIESASATAKGIRRAASMVSPSMELLSGPPSDTEAAPIPPAVYSHVLPPIPDSRPHSHTYSTAPSLHRAGLPPSFHPHHT